MRSFVTLALIIGAVVLAATFIAPKLQQLDGAKVGKSLSNLSWTDCDGTGSRYVSIDSIQVTGDFSVGSTATFDISGNINQEFTHASTDLQVKYSIINVFNGNVQVNPAKHYDAGLTVLSNSVEVTKSAPSGKYSMIVKMNDPSGEKLQCISVKFNLS